MIYLAGLPCALSTNVLKDIVFGGKDLMGIIDYLATAILIPIGGLLSVLLVGWCWKPKNILENIPNRLNVAMKFLIKFLIPVFILFVAISEFS